MPIAPATPAFGYTVQHTLKSRVQCSGIGLHSGKPVTVTVSPSEADSGIRFRRSDLGHPTPIAADWRHVVDGRRATTIEADGNGVATIEHLMAALAACGVDNAIIDIDHGELPALDGSALPYVEALGDAGLERQAAPRRAIQVLNPVSVADGSREARLEPAASSSIAFAISYPGTLIGDQSLEVDVAIHDLRQEICPARTYCLRSEIEALHAGGLGLGGTLDNTLVVDRMSLANEGPLRFPDEFVRHKILDCLGDLWLLGRPLIGRFVGRRSGHAMTHALLAALMADPAAWREVEMDRNSV